MNVFIAGDVVPRNRTVDLFRQKQTDILFRDLIPYIGEADVSIVNFEAPIICGEETRIQKSGPTLHTTRETLEVLKEVGFNTITLANNHFRDQGQQGVDCTIDAAKLLEMDYVGGGKTLEEARRILYKDVDGKKLAIINVCEHEFSIASAEYGGSNPLDTIDTFKDIMMAKKRADNVLLIVHGGIEHYQLPTPRMKKLYRFFVESGADAVVNHHQHCFSGYEVYNGKPIFYGLGNFNFDSYKTNISPTTWNSGYAVKLIFNEASISFEIIPYLQNAKDVGIFPISIIEFKERIDKLNEKIIDDKKLAEEYCAYSKTIQKELLLSLIPLSNRYMKGVLRRLNINLFATTQLLTIKNKINCESHLETLKYVINEAIVKK